MGGLYCFAGLVSSLVRFLHMSSVLEGSASDLVIESFSQQQHCKVDATLNTGLIAMFSHSVSWDWITILDPAVCTGEFSHLLEPPYSFTKMC